MMRRGLFLVSLFGLAWSVVFVSGNLYAANPTGVRYQMFPRTMVYRAPSTNIQATQQPAPAASENLTTGENAEGVAVSNAPASEPQELKVAQETQPEQVRAPQVNSNPMNLRVRSYDRNGNPYYGLGFDGIPFNGSHLEAIRLNRSYRR